MRSERDRELCTGHISDRRFFRVFSPSPSTEPGYVQFSTTRHVDHDVRTRLHDGRRAPDGGPPRALQRKLVLDLVITMVYTCGHHLCARARVRTVDGRRRRRRDRGRAVTADPKPAYRPLRRRLEDLRKSTCGLRCRRHVTPRSRPGRNVRTYYRGNNNASTTDIYIGT